MNNEKQTALKKVREVCFTEKQGQHIAVMQKTPHLEHFLRVLDTQGKLYQFCNRGVLYHGKKIIHFDLKTGHPKTEKDYKSFNEICV